MSDERGLIISNPIRIHPDGDTIDLSAGLDPQELRTNLLFWDKLDFPKNRLFAMDPEPDVQFLQSVGILQRTQGNVRGGSGGQILRRTFIETFYQLDEKEPGQWSVSIGPRSLSFENDELVPERGALVNLYGAIPVPNQDVALADLLDFKENRRDELLALRHHLERIYQRVVNAGDGALALNTEMSALESAVHDHEKVMRESHFSLRLSGISASLNVIAPVAGALTAMSMNLPLVAGIIPGIAAGLSLNVGLALKNKKENATPFQYVSSYHKELF